MKTKRTSKPSARTQIQDFAAILRAEAGKTPSGFYCRSEEPKARRVFWRRAATVQAAYDNAPPGGEAIAAAVWRKLQSFRPKLTARELDDLVSTKFRGDVLSLLFRKTAQIRNQENNAAQAADDARRAARMGRKGVTHG